MMLLLMFQGLETTSIKLEDLLDYLNPSTAVLKVDVEGHECKVSESIIGLTYRP